jgi:Fe2+ transport system protein FeoA
VDFDVAKRDSVLMVPNEALGFVPDQQTLDKYKTSLQKNYSSYAKTYKDSSQHKSSGYSPKDTAKQHFKNLNIGKVWSLDNKGNLKQNFLVLGITDGKNTEIVKSKSLNEGMNVIIGMVSSNGTKKVNSSVQGGRMSRGLGRGL